MFKALIEASVRFRWFVVLAVAIWFLSSDAALTRSLHALLGITDPSRATDRTD